MRNGTTNVIKCRPKNNRTPTVEEGQFCATNWLDQKLAFCPSSGNHRTGQRGFKISVIA